MGFWGVFLVSGGVRGGRALGMGAKRKLDWPRVVRFETGRVRISKRKDGRFALAWREDGADRATTLKDESEALEWAGQKARELDGKSGRRWISPGEAEQLAELHRVVGSADPAAVREFLVDAAAARRILEGGASMAVAARWMADHGPLKVERANVHAAIGRFLAEYDGGKKATRTTFGTELEGYVEQRADGPLLDLSAEVLLEWCRRKTPVGKVPAPRTVKNRMTTWITFLNRCRVWKLLPPGQHAGEALRRPKLPGAGREILTVAQGAALLEAVRRLDRRIEAYLLIGGWLGLRPSEIQRLRWKHLEEVQGYCRVTPEVAQKVEQERYVPMEAGLAVALAAAKAATGKTSEDLVCPWRAREFLSVLARKERVVAQWPSDVLRHSFCSYRLAITKDLARTAEEAGNSPAIIRKHYRRPMTPEEGEAWWAILSDGV